MPHSGIQSAILGQGHLKFHATSPHSRRGKRIELAHALRTTVEDGESVTLYGQDTQELDAILLILRTWLPDCSVKRVLRPKGGYSCYIGPALAPGAAQQGIPHQRKLPR